MTGQAVCTETERSSMMLFARVWNTQPYQLAIYAHRFNAARPLNIYIYIYIYICNNIYSTMVQPQPQYTLRIHALSLNLRLLPSADLFTKGKAGLFRWYDNISAVLQSETIKISRPATRTALHVLSLDLSSSIGIDYRRNSHALPYNLHLPSLAIAI